MNFKGRIKRLRQRLPVTDERLSTPEEAEAIARLFAQVLGLDPDTQQEEACQRFLPDGTVASYERALAKLPRAQLDVLVDGFLEIGCRFGWEDAKRLQTSIIPDTGPHAGWRP